MAKDSVQSIIDQVRAAAPGLSENQLTTIAEGIRRDMGGESHYITKKTPVSEKVSRLAASLARGVPLTEVFASANVSRAWGYRLMARRWRG